MVDLTPLKNALKSLEDIILQPVNEYIRDGVIQRFEFTFELSWKTIKRYLKEEGGRPDLQVGPKPIIREAGKAGLIDDVKKWFNFLEARNKSTHVYDEEEANIIYKTALEFPNHVKTLIKNLEKK